MYVKLDVSNTDYFRVCGSNVKESMERVHFFFDFNVTTRDRNYVPSKNLVHWKKRNYVQDECTLVSGVPPGHHVLALVCAGGGCAFTHLVSFV
jgi:hypothetical protein